MTAALLVIDLQRVLCEGRHQARITRPNSQSL